MKHSLEENLKQYIVNEAERLNDIEAEKKEALHLLCDMEYRETLTQEKDRALFSTFNALDARCEELRLSIRKITLIVNGMDAETVLNAYKTA